MSIAPSERPASEDLPDVEKPVKRTKRRSTSHLKAVPETLAERERVQAAAEEYAKELDHSRPFNKNELEQHARELMSRMELPEKFLGFVMVMIGNFFWKRQFLATPFERRMLLLPHCLKHAEGCPAEYDQFGLDCEKCGACSIADYKVTAEKLGYRVLVAEGSPIVLKIIVGGYIDAILGVACLNVLEKAIDKVLIAGVPSYAIPLHSGDCKNTTLDESWVWEVLDKYEPLTEQATSSYLPLMRASSRLFEDDFERLLPPIRTRKASPEAPIAKTEAVAYDWLKNGGKRFRPFITLAAYDAMNAGEHSNNGIDHEATVPDGVGRIAMAIEAFHKASLVHDDIQDGDQYRYGRTTLHREHGIGPAINIGDYLIGIGYRLIHSAAADFGPEVTCDILDRMSTAHIKLCDGQGAEMAWQRSPDWNIRPIDALQIYALKTSPAFEAALYAGIRMAGDAEQYDELVATFSRHLGVGFQVLNDLKDWRGDQDNKLIAGQDAIALRPTVLLALALESANEDQREELMSILTGDDEPELRRGRLGRLFESLDVFGKAEALVEKSKARVEALADNVEPEELRRLLYFFIDTVLSEEDQTPIAPGKDNLVSLPIVGG